MLYKDLNPNNLTVILNNALGHGRVKDLEHGLSETIGEIRNCIKNGDNIRQISYYLKGQGLYSIREVFTLLAVNISHYSGKESPINPYAD